MMKNLLTPFIDKFRSDWALFLEHYEAYTLICVIALGIGIYLRLREKK